jgi:hypothetical protein
MNISKIVPLDAQQAGPSRQGMVNFDVASDLTAVRVGLTPAGARAMAAWLDAEASRLEAATVAVPAPLADTSDAAVERSWAAARCAVDHSGTIFGIDPDRDRI